MNFSGCHLINGSCIKSSGCRLTWVVCFTYSQTGYKLHDRVIRPAVVGVVKS
jgi:hypothetical protein